MARIAALAALLAVTAIVAACDYLPRSVPERTPELVGIVTSLEARPGLPLLHLADGQTYDMNDATPIVRIGTIEPGGLLLAGTEHGKWFAFLRESSPGCGCFELYGGGKDNGATIVTSDGLVLTKAPSFSSPDDTDGTYDMPGYSFYLDSDGHVTAYR